MMNKYVTKSNRLYSVYNDLSSSALLHDNRSFKTIQDNLQGFPEKLISDDTVGGMG